MIYTGMIMDGPLKGERKAWDRSYFDVAETAVTELMAPLDGPPQVHLALSAKQWRYVYVEAGGSRLPGWYVS